MLVRAALASALALALALQVSANARAQAPTVDKEQCLATHERAQVDRLQGRLLDARTSLLVCAQRGCPRLVSKDCTVWLSEVDASLPTVVFSAAGANGEELSAVKVTAGGRTLTNHFDGQPLMLDPGPYSLRFETPDHEPLTQQVTIHEGEKGRVLRVTLRPLSAESPAVLTTQNAEQADERAPRPNERRGKRMLITSSVLMAGGAASLIAALPLGLRGEKLKDKCDVMCSEPERDRGRRLFRAVNYSAAVGGAVFLTGAALLWPALRKRGAEQRDAGARGALVHPYATRDGGGAVLQARW